MNRSRGRQKTIACKRCHDHKIRCNGNGTQPCGNCRRTSHQGSCTYPSRDRQIKVSESYVEKLLEENRRLNGATSGSQTPVNAASGDTTASPANIPADQVQNPLLDETPWFHQSIDAEAPIHIDEAADSAFSTRFRQALSNSPLAHYPRTSYVSDVEIAQASASPREAWPDPLRVQRLVNVALDTSCRGLHLIHPKEVAEQVGKIVLNPPSDSPQCCKLWVLLAIGEIYVAKNNFAERPIPGLSYFGQAQRIYRSVCERPRLDLVAIAALMSIYSFAMNRRHASYLYAGNAMRTASILGLHQSAPPAEFPDVTEREHRKGVFWSAYICDRTAASRMGQPVSIQDNSIGVDLPNKAAWAESGYRDFDYMIANVSLARQTGHFVSNIYSRGPQLLPFPDRVQAALRELFAWRDQIPESLQIHQTRPLNDTTYLQRRLQLSYNQCLILVTRPTLLQVFRQRQSATNSSSNAISSESDPAITLAETCMQCARRTNNLLTEAWAMGSFPTYDYKSAQCLFSSAIVLAVSSRMGHGQSASDFEAFDFSCQVLKQLETCGSLPAKEFTVHLTAVKTLMASQSSQGNGMPAPSNRPSASSMEPCHVPLGRHEEMYDWEASLQDIIAQPEISLQFPEHLYSAASFSFNTAPYSMQ